MGKLKNMPISSVNDHPVDFYSWGDVSLVGIVSKKEQFNEKISEAFDSIEIKEDTTTPEMDYVLSVLGKEAGHIVMPFDMVVKDAYYDKDTKEAVIVIRISETEDKEIRFSVKDLIDIYTGDEITIHVEDKTISITDTVMGKFDELQGNIDTEKQNREENDKKLHQDLEDEASTREAEDTILNQLINTIQQNVETAVSDFSSRFEGLENDIQSELKRAETAEKENATNIAKVETDYKEADNTLKNELEEKLSEKTKDMVEWQYSTEDRKHIILGNHENVLGTSTNGGTYNLAMVSKWDVADFGSNQLHANLNSKDGQVTINDDKVVATTEDITSSEERIQEKIDGKADKVHTHEISDVVNLQPTLDTKLNADDVQAMLKEQIYKIFHIDMVKADDLVKTEMNDPSEKYAVVGNGETIELTSTKAIVAEGLKMTDVNLYSDASEKGLLTIDANNVEIEDTNISGSWNRTVGGNTMVTVNNAQNVSFKDVTVSRTDGYNAIEIGLDGKGTAETIIIDGLEITEKLSNNGINIFSFEDNANVVIKNCHFTEVSNPIRISNATYAKNVNITIKDCTFDKWESSSPAYAGLVLLQDYTSKTKEDALEKKPFGTFTLTLDNVTGPYGKIDNTSTIEEMCGSGIVDKQLVYVYADKAGLIPYSEDIFPIIIIIK